MSAVRFEDGGEAAPPAIRSSARPSKGALRDSTKRVSFGGAQGSSFAAGANRQSSRNSKRGSNAYTASRLEMMQSGVPNDYIDALLDEEYMQKLIVSNDHLNKMRRQRLQRYLRMNNIVFYFLVCQAVLGIWVAFYKTLLQADYVYSGEAELQNIDLMLMVDSSGHMGVNMELQHKAVTNFTANLNITMDEKRIGVENTLQDTLNQNSVREGGFRSYFPFLKWFSSAAAQNQASVHGGWLRIATATFNAEESATIHGFTRDRSVQEEKLAELKVSDYASHAQWLDAFRRCEYLAKNGGHKDALRYCVLLSDNAAMCRKSVSDDVKEACEWWPTTCPEGTQLNDRGEVIGWPDEEMVYCTEFVKKELKAMNTDIIMMFTVEKKSQQARLSDAHFRRFIAETTNCTIARNLDKGLWETAGGNDTSCTRFIMAADFDELAEKSKEVAKLLKAESKVESDLNEQKDLRYLFFLILPMNLVFYIIWSKILRCTMHVKKTADRAMGVKKKMIKVTKTLVEKPRRDSVVEMFEANLTEVELAEVASLRPNVECGNAMTLRARLKGGYLRVDQATQGLDGKGGAFDDTSNFFFEPADAVGNSKGAPLQAGSKMKIRNQAGQVLRIDANGTKWVNDRKGKKGGGLGGIAEGDEDEDSAGAADESQEFIIEHGDCGEGDDQNDPRLGDAIRIKCCATGKFMRVHKDGRCDGFGEFGDAETQMNIDMGGQTINTNTVIALKSGATGGFMFGDSEGNLSAVPGGDTWKFWQLEKKIEHCQDGEGGEGEGGDGGSAKVDVANLKVGDCITLKGINQNMLEVGSDGQTVHCGKHPSAPGDPENPDAPVPAGEAAGSGCQEFIVERVGMGLLHTHDKTVRTGAQICLRPRLPATNAADAGNYLNVGGDGQVTADGRVTTGTIGFTMEVASMQDMVTPISDHLLKGDMELMISPLWNKHEIKRLEALSAPWTVENDLSQFRGAVVVANEKGQYTVPKAKGDSFNGWVAVIKDGVDITKAAKQAKAQGATGIIIKTSEVLSMDKLARNQGAAIPELPAVYVDEALAEQLNERGITLNGTEFKGKNRTAALRSIGRAGAQNDEDAGLTAREMKSKTVGKTADVFANVGALMCEKAEEELEEEKNRPIKQDHGGEEEVDDEGGAGAGFKWKVAANTHYLWASSAGGGVMNVNFGKKAPPSASRKQRVNIATGEVDHSTDASQHHVNAAVKAKKKINLMGEKRGSVVSVTMVDSDDVKQKTIQGFADDLGEIMTDEQAAQPLEQLPDDSDFKIEYAFEEVEVAVGEKVEDDIEEELLDDSGAVVGRFAVPPSQFWAVLVGCFFSTLTLGCTLWWLLQTKGKPKDMETQSDYDKNLDDPNAGMGNPGDPPAVEFAKQLGGAMFRKAVSTLRGPSVINH